MKPGLPWSVKGIEPKAREAAKTAARKQGLTLGVWLTNTILQAASDRPAKGSPDSKARPRKEDKAGPEISGALSTLADSIAKSQASMAKSVDGLSRRLARMEGKVGAAAPSRWAGGSPLSSGVLGLTVLGVLCLVVVLATFYMWNAFLFGDGGVSKPTAVGPAVAVAPKDKAEDITAAEDVLTTATLGGEATLDVELEDEEATDLENEDISWLREAAEQGVAIAQYDMGLAFMEGNGVPRNYEVARRWFEKAAAQTSSDAQFHLGVLYEHGLGVEASDGSAAYWYQVAASRGHLTAIHNLAVMYATGRGLARDYRMAAQWFRRAADRGFANSQYNLAALYERGLGVTRDPAASYRWYGLAVRRGFAGAEARGKVVADELASNQIEELNEEIDLWEPYPEGAADLTRDSSAEKP